MNKLLDRKLLIPNLLYFLMVFSLMYIVGMVINLDLLFLEQVILIFIISMVVRFIIKNTIVFYLSLILSIIGGLVINSYITPIYPYFQRLIVLLYNLYEHIFMDQIIQSENILPFWILMAIIYSIFTSITVFRPREKLFSLLFIYLPLFIYYWYIYINEAYIAMAIFLFSYFVLSGMLNYKKEKSKVEQGLRKQFSKLSTFWNRTTVVYGILIIAIALILPKSDDNIRWIWMEDQIASIVPKIESMRPSNIQSTATESRQAGLFNFSTTGFQQDPSRLGGPISLNNRLIMYVRTDDTTYLRGAVRHIYDGSIWNSMPKENTTSHSLESNFSNISYDDRENFYEEKDVIVQFVNYSSTTLFSPYMPIVVNADRGDHISLMEDHIIELPEGLYNDETYGIKLLQAKPYGELLHRGINNRFEDIENLDYYLQVPMDKITQRTIDLKDDIVSGVEGNFEKALAIESYLRDNYDYTLDTSPIPRGHEFIDYFLFEEKAGYCTYYATAMTIFLRLEGIPSRYVEGYIAHESSDDEIYQVRQSHAHAWVEAFIEPVGWMTFEPTSAYPLEDRELDQLSTDDEEMLQDDETTAEENSQLEQDISTDYDITMNNDSEVSNETEENSISLGKIVLIILGVIVLIAPLRFLVRVIRYKIDENKIHKLPNYKKMIVLYEKILQLTEKLGHPKKDGETHYEYSNRIGYKFKELRGLTKIFVRNKYGNTVPSDEEVQKFVDYKLELEERLKNSLGKFKYYLEKY